MGSSAAPVFFIDDHLFQGQDCRFMATFVYKAGVFGTNWRKGGATCSNDFILRQKNEQVHQDTE